MGYNKNIILICGLFFLLAIAIVILTIGFLSIERNPDRFQAFFDKNTEFSYPIFHENITHIELFTVSEDIGNFLRGAQAKTENETIDILGRVPFYDSSNVIIAYEYILESDDVFIGSIYEVLIPAISYQAKTTKFFTPGYSLAKTLVKESGYTTSGLFLHFDNCIKNNYSTYCLNPLTDISSSSGKIINPSINTYNQIEEKMKNYFGSWGYISIKDDFLYYSPSNKRIWSPVPMEILTESDIILSKSK